MQDINWNDYKILLALFRCGTFSGAARALGVNETTIARHIARLEQELKVTLFRRDGAGHCVLTDQGAHLLKTAESMEKLNDSFLRDHVGFGDGQRHRLSISAVPFVINQILIPNFSTFSQSRPDIALEFIQASHNHDIAKRQANLALRMAAPTQGAAQVKAQKLATLEFAVFARGDKYNQDLPWIGYGADARHLPQAIWLEKAAQQATSQRAAMRVNDLESALNAVCLGLGKSLLPCGIAQRHPELKQIDPPADADGLPSRGIYLMSLIDHPQRLLIKAVETWLRSTLKAPYHSEA